MFFGKGRGQKVGDPRIPPTDRLTVTPAARKEKVVKLTEERIGELLCEAEELKQRKSGEQGAKVDEEVDVSPFLDFFEH